MIMDRDKEREAELEGLMFANCLMLGLDPFVIGAVGSSGIPRAGLFRHSNPKVGEQLLYFILSCLRGPNQSAKDFDKVWPIFDSSQSRDFRKVVQNIISELESQGALPRCNSRVSSLATCCGPRFVELLWQLSLHALREVHKRTYPDDVASNPLPASLTDVSFSHASALLPVTKARIALERRKFLKNAEDALRQQTDWSNLAHELTAQYRSLRADEEFLKQELEMMQECSSSTQDGNDGDHFSVASKATSIWASILSLKSKHEVLASGPIEDLIAHREHRYRISGSSLVAAMDRSNENLDCVDEIPMKLSDGMGALEALHSDEGRGSNHHSVDVAEVFRRWTQALQQVHKQSLQLAKANGGDGPELLMQRSCSGSSSHCDALGAVLSEQQQHHANIQGLINQVKEVYSTLHKSIGALEEEVSRVSTFPSPTTLKQRPIEEGDYSAAAAARVVGNLSVQVRLTVPIQHDSVQGKSVSDLLFPEFSSAEKDPSIEDLPEYDIEDLKRSVRAEATSLPAPVETGEHFFVPGRGSRWEEEDPVHSPPLLLLESCINYAADEDLLAPLSELEAAMMER